MNTDQAPTPSVEERVGKAFANFAGFPEKKPEAAPIQAQEPEAELPEPSAETTTEVPEAPAVDETFEFEIDGETYAVPKKLEKAFQNNRDYTQKSQDVANQRRTFEVLHEQAKVASLRGAFETENAKDLQQLQAYDSVLEQYKSFDWNSLTTEQILRERVKIDQWKAEREDIARKLTTNHQQWVQRHEQALADLKTKAEEAVSKRIPNWNDESWKAVREHAKSDGYTEAELADILDPRHKVTLWKAQQFDQLKAKATKTVIDAKGIRTTSSNPMPAAVKDKLNFRKVIAKTQPGSPERRAAVESRIGSIFAKR
jgi:hypothetical protein